MSDTPDSLPTSAPVDNRTPEELRAENLALKRALLPFAKAYRYDIVFDLDPKTQEEIDSLEMSPGLRMRDYRRAIETMKNIWPANLSKT